MKLRTIIIAFVTAIVAATVVIGLRHRPDPLSYLKEIQQEREKKDAFMQNDPESPFRLVAETFKGLKYFPPDPAYKVKASLTTIEEKKIRTVGNSDNTTNEYLEFAWAEFELEGVKNKLLILEITEPGPTRGTLFLSFADGTSAGETYGAGRYLDIKKIPAMTSVMLDFNNAYNPYCAYSDKYTCPFPPPENILKVAVTAGEKSYH